MVHFDMIFRKLFHLSHDDEAAYALYGTAVGQARRPEFYLSQGVPDTVDGRFDMIALHTFLLTHRLMTDGQGALAVLSQQVFDVMFADMDRNLREMGVGDLSVGTKVKQMVSAFLGRAKAYEAGLGAEADPSLLEDSLRRNLYRGTEPDSAHLRAMAGYLRREALFLASQPRNAAEAGRLVFGSPPSGEPHVG